MVAGRRGMLMLVLLEECKAILDAGVAEGVAAIWQKDRHALSFVVNLPAQGTLDLFNVH